MTMHLSSSHLLILFVVTATGIAGCTQGQGPVQSDTPVPVTFPQLQDLALNRTDLPACFSLTEQNVKRFSDVGQLARDLGWQAGYTATFTCPAEGSVPTVLVHSLAVYPANTLSGIASMVDEQDREEGFLYENLSFADQGIPVRGFYGKNGGTYSGTLPGTVMGGGAEMNTGNGSTVSEIIFSRGTIFEVLKMTGPGTNVTLLRELEQKASAKIS